MRDAEIDAFLCVIRAQLAQLYATNDRGAKDRQARRAAEPRELRLRHHGAEEQRVGQGRLMMDWVEELAAIHRKLSTMILTEWHIEALEELIGLLLYKVQKLGEDRHAEARSSSAGGSSSSGTVGE